MNYVIEDYAELKAALRAMCAELDGESLRFNGKLVAMELVSNVLQHGGGKAYFSYTYAEGELRMSVRGENGFRPPVRSKLADTSAESGRGLFLVDTIVDKREYDPQCGVSVVLIMKE